MNKPIDSFQGRPIVAQHAGVTVTRVGAHLGAEITGVDLRKPMSDEVRDAIEDALAENELLVFRNQDISSENLIDFGRRFGELTVHPFAPRDKDVSVLIKFRNDETNPPFRTDVWHSDETFRKEPPKATILVAKEVPAIGGDTMFASMSAAFEGLSDRMQHFISGLEAVHDFKPFRELFDDSEEDRKNVMRWEVLYPPAVHPVVRVHPVTGRKVLFVNPQFTVGDQEHGRAREPSRCSTSCSSRRRFRNISSAIIGRRTRSSCGTTARPSITRSTTTSRSAATWSASPSRAARWRASSAPILKTSARPSGAARAGRDPHTASRRRRSHRKQPRSSRGRVEQGQPSCPICASLFWRPRPSCCRRAPPRRKRGPAGLSRCWSRCRLAASPISWREKSRKL